MDNLPNIAKKKINFNQIAKSPYSFRNRAFCLFVMKKKLGEL